MSTKRNELFTYYSLSECFDRDELFKELDKLMDEGKIEYYYEIISESLKIVDLELSDGEIINITNTFYDCDVIPDMDYTEDDYKGDDFEDMGYYEEYE